MSTEEKKLPQPPAGEAKQESKNRIRAMFLGLVVVMLMSSLNQTILAPSLPTIVGELHGVEHMSWVITISSCFRRLRCRSTASFLTSSDASPS